MSADPTGPTADPTGPTADPTGPTADSTGPTADSIGLTSSLDAPASSKCFEDDPLTSEPAPEVLKNGFIPCKSLHQI